MRYGLGVVAVVLDNGAWGAEKAYQQEFFGGRTLGADLNNPPYDEFARLCGGRGWRVVRPGELSLALGEALGLGEPSVIHVKIDPTALTTLRKDLFEPSLAEKRSEKEAEKEAEKGAEQGGEEGGEQGVIMVMSSSYG